MADPREPSMEDILASIKKVIAEEKELRAAAPPPMAAEAEEPAAEEVLELDEPVVEELALPEVDLGPPLVSEDAAQSSRQKLAALQEVAATAPPPQPQANPLEQVVREMLRPILKEWLDQHLPEIVDEHVKREISRITGAQF
ncbi:DUF2497 domain-containing protein [Sphingomonas sp. GCM10030256]|uniref:DUF2497 domain-containing protein n=1 Tax=Sphingomonas sp. GCM10030256 TaxID=3273427 RepID=UPI0036223CC7